MRQVANTSPLGYAAFALALWLTSMAPAGWFDRPWDNLLLLLLVAALGGCALAVAGVLQWLRANTLDCVLFVAFAAYWWVLALNEHALATGTAAAPSAGFLGWYYAVWTALAFAVWLAAWRSDVARLLFTLGLWLSLFAYALAAWLRIAGVTMLGGYLGLITAIVGFYIAAAEIVNQVHGRVVLPLGQLAYPAPPDER